MTSMSLAPSLVQRTKLGGTMVACLLSWQPCDSERLATARAHLDYWSKQQLNGAGAVVTVRLTTCSVATTISTIGWNSNWTDLKVRRLTADCQCRPSWAPPSSMACPLCMRWNIRKNASLFEAEPSHEIARPVICSQNVMNTRWMIRSTSPTRSNCQGMTSLAPCPGAVWHGRFTTGFRAVSPLPLKKDRRQE